MASGLNLTRASFRLRAKGSVTSVLSLDQAGDAGVVDERRRGIFFRALAPVEDDFEFDSALVRIHQRPGDGRGGKGVSLDQHR